MVMGVPISAYGTAFYFVMIALALFIGFGPSERLGAVRLPILLLGLSGLFVSILLGLYAWFGLGVWCIYCTLLYIANFGIFLASRLMNPEGIFRGVVNGFRRFDISTTMITWAAVTTLIATVVVQQRAYKQYAARAVRDRMQYTLLSCPEENLRELPDTSFRLRSSGTPQIIVALFIDLACSHCRKEVEFWKTYQKKNTGFLQVEFFHFSADSACGPLNSHALQSNQSCNGALLLECLNTLRGGAASDTLSSIFSFQGRKSPFFSVENIQEFSNETGVKGLVECMNQSEAIQRVRQHIHFGISKNLNAPPSALIIPTRNGKPFGVAWRLQGGDKSEKYIDLLIEKVLGRTYKNDK